MYLIFFLTYTPLDTDHVRGVQGRYFIIVLPVAAIFLAAAADRELPYRMNAILAALGAMTSGIVTIEALWQALVNTARPGLCFGEGSLSFGRNWEASALRSLSCPLARSAGHDICGLKVIRIGQDAHGAVSASKSENQRSTGAVLINARKSASGAHREKFPRSEPYRLA